MRKTIVNSFVMVVLALVMVGAATAITPGTATKLNTMNLKTTVSEGLQPVVTENGKISWSIDANGENTGTGGLRVQKPSGATVRKAYLMAASTGFSNYQITSSDITLAGSPVTFSTEIPNGISSYNYFTDVTSIVKPIIDSASSGITNLTVTESPSSTSSIEGETLVVIFNDPNQVNDNTIILAFGAQQTTGDNFNIGLANPIDKSAPGFLLDMSLGISFSYQTDSAQYSIVDINSQRLTTSAGGEDDGASENGALITTGGIGDSTANPADPNALPTNPRSDDELYNLVPFVNNGDTSIVAHTLNPSNDDNIYFAGFFMGSTTAVSGEGIILAPESATNQLNADHTVTATVQGADGKPITNTMVHFEIISGPNTGLKTDVFMDDVKGKVSWTYTSTVVGVDTIQASFHDVTGKLITSNEVTKTWETSTEQCVSDLTVVSGTLTGANGPIANQSVDVKCTHDSEDTTLSAVTKSDGSYSVVFPKTQCAPGDTITLDALDKEVQGVVTNNCKCVVNLGFLDLTIPEFGIIGGALALIGALAIIIYRRK